MAITWHETPAPPTLHENAAHALAHAVTVRDKAQASVDASVIAARRCGLPWATIAAALGVSKQAAHQRYGGGGAA